MAAGAIRFCKDIFTIEIFFLSSFFPLRKRFLFIASAFIVVGGRLPVAFSTLGRRRYRGLGLMGGTEPRSVNEEPVQTKRNQRRKLQPLGLWLTAQHLHRDSLCRTRRARRWPLVAVAVPVPPLPLRRNSKSHHEYERVGLTWGGGALFGELIRIRARTCHTSFAVIRACQMSKAPKGALFSSRTTDDPATSSPPRHRRP